MLGSVMSVAQHAPCFLLVACTGKAQPVFTFQEGKCEVTLTLDLKEGTLKFTHNGRAIGTIAGVLGLLHAAVTLTNSKQTVRGMLVWPSCVHANGRDGLLANSCSGCFTAHQKHSCTSAAFPSHSITYLMPN